VPLTPPLGRPASPPHPASASRGAAEAGPGHGDAQDTVQHGHPRARQPGRLQP